MVDQQGAKHSGNGENRQELEGPLSFKVGKSKVVVQISESCDASQLEVEVFETAFGKTWLNHNAHGTEIFYAKGLQLVDVQGDQQITKVGVQLGSTL